MFLFVIVLYNMTASDSPAVTSLLKQRSLLTAHGIHLLLVDNTPGIAAHSSAVDSDIHYLAFGENKGLAMAYQSAFCFAMAAGRRYLVLCDQDSEISKEYIDSLGVVSRETSSRVGIWAPSMVCKGSTISPYSFNRFGWPDYSVRGPSARLYGINSCSVLNMSFIGAIGGFDEFYWLDGLDGWIFEQAHRTGWAVRRLNVAIAHKLSLLSGQVPAARLSCIAYYDSCLAVECGPIARIISTIVRLAIRGIWRLPVSRRGYWSYLCEIVAGAKMGWKRRPER